MIRQNIATLVNSATIRRDVMYNNRKHIVVTSKTLPFDVVMNDILYTKDQILANYQKLDGTPAPIGHPKNASGEFISAKAPEGVNLSYVGAWNRNPRIVGNRVELETWIDEEVANRTPEGRELLERINEGKPISTSVAVLANRIEQRGKNYSAVADIQDMDHNAILLHEPPAAGIDQGVGLLVNADLAESVDEESFTDKVKSAVKALFSNNELIINEEEKSKMEEKLKQAEEKIAELEAKLAEKEKASITANEALTNANKELSDRIEKIEKALIANENKALEEKRAKVAKILGNEAAAEMGETALDAVLAKAGTTHEILPNSHKEEKQEIPSMDYLKGAK